MAAERRPDNIRLTLDAVVERLRLGPPGGG